MTRYLLNSPVLTAFGEWTYDGPLTVYQACAWLDQGSFESAIGHASTAAELSRLLGRPIGHNRIQVAMEAGDEALVYRIGRRLGEGQVVDEPTLNILPWDLSLLKRIR